MPAIVVVGTQRGDEGKGKVIDELIENEQASYVVRFQGGNNAGHTLCLPDNSQLILHLLSSGVMHDCILGQTSSVVNDLMQMDCEIKEVDVRLKKDIRRQLRLDQRVMMILPYHRLADFAIESHLERTTGVKVGSTGRGMKPAYIDEVEGREIRLFDLADKDRFARKVRDNALLWTRKISALYGIGEDEFRVFGKQIAAAEHRAKEEKTGLVTKGILQPGDFDYLQFMRQWVGFDADRIIDVYLSLYESIKHCVCDLSDELNSALIRGENVVFEGAQGAVLDKSWAYGHNRTHSNTITGAVSTSAGISPRYIERIIGVSKAYGTGVGTHVLPTEIEDSPLKEKLMKVEFGSTTGRQRMVYWLNLPEDRVAARITGVTEGVMNKLDLLTGAEKLKICVALRHGDKRYELAPPDLDIIRECVPIYEELEGWTKDISGCRSFDDLPLNAQAYARFYEAEMRKVIPEFRLTRIGVGPRRADVIKIV
jgi:adenylosuccinate synthase